MSLVDVFFFKTCIVLCSQRGSVRGWLTNFYGVLLFEMLSHIFTINYLGTSNGCFAFFSIRSLYLSLGCFPCRRALLQNLNAFGTNVTTGEHTKKLNGKQKKKQPTVNRHSLLFVYQIYCKPRAHSPHSTFGHKNFPPT